METEPWIGRHHPVAHRVRGIIEPVLRRRGLELVNIRFAEGRNSSSLEVYADAPGGISLAQLEDLSRTLGDILDAEDPIVGHYDLQVSSPGVDRPLTTARHFEAAMGELVQVSSLAKVGGSRRHRGILSGFGPQGLVVQVEGSARTIAVDLIDSAHTVYMFEPVVKPGKKPSPARRDPVKKPPAQSKAAPQEE